MPTNASSILRTALPAARAGSRDALGQTLNQCRDYLLEVARRALGPGLRAKGGASDLVQDTFLEAQRRFGQFDGDSNGQLRAWLRSLLLHKAGKLGRRYHGTHKRQLSREIPLGSAGASTVHPSQVASRGPTPSVIISSEEQQIRLLQAIDRLPEDYRTVMTLRYQEALPFDEIGRRLGRSADAARMLWARAVDRLKQEMANSEW
jgi:RNA polymerase sigma-70 factor (ECF subfamily)